MSVEVHDRTSETNGGMQIKTILNRIQKHRVFVYGTVQLEEHIGGLALTVDIAPHRRNRPRCAACGHAGPVYDRLAPRRFEFVPLWGLRVFFLYVMRRVACPTCGVTVEQVPWADGKHQLTTTYQWFLATWAKRLSWCSTQRRCPSGNCQPSSSGSGTARTEHSGHKSKGSCRGPREGKAAAIRTS